MLKLQCFGHMMQRADSLGMTTMLEKIEGRRRRGWQRMRCLDDITDSMDIRLSKHREIVKDRGAWHAAVHGFTKSWTWLSDWTTTTTVKGPIKAFPEISYDKRHPHQSGNAKDFRSSVTAVGDKNQTRIYCLSYYRYKSMIHVNNSFHSSSFVVMGL